MEDTPVERDCVECAELEDTRVRQSEAVNMQAVLLHERLEALLGSYHTGAAGSSVIGTLPTEVLEALSQLLEGYEEEMAEMRSAAHLYESEQARSVAKVASLAGKAEKMRSESSYLSERNSANLKGFREQLKVSSDLAKERNRDLAGLNRKREKAEMDIKRSDMEIERLRKISKRSK